jgi:hypothetical protein
VGFLVFGAWAAGALALALAVLRWVRPLRLVGTAALVLGVAGCGLALALPFLSFSTTANTPNWGAEKISCGSVSTPRTDFSLYQYVGQDETDPKLQGKDLNGESVGPGAEPQQACRSALSGARLGAIGGGGLAALGLLLTVVYAYRRPPAVAPESGSEAPDAEVSV